MTDNNGRAQDETPENEGGQTMTQNSAAADQEAVPTDPAALAQEAADLKDRLLRSLAEMENLRRRTEREVAGERAKAIASFAREVLPVADDLRRALEAVGPELRANADPGVIALIEGLELTERELMKVFDRFNVKRIDAEGQKFDPNFHEAMFELPDDSVPAGTVVQVVQPGYQIGDRVLRPALVGVAKGGPRAPRESPANDNQDNQTAED
jgi:molecular chaperone GrpE